MDKKKTVELQEILMNTSSKRELEHHFKEMEEDFNAPGFLDYYLNHPKVTALGEDYKAKIIKATNLNREYTYHILNGTKNPGRDKVISLCVAAHFTLEETNKALTCSNLKCLYARDKRDAIIIFGINKGLSNFDISELIYDFLGEDSK